MFRIKKLDIFITKQFGLLFVGTFFICQFVLMMQFLWRYVDELIGKGLSLEIMAQFFWYMGLMLMPQAFPLAILLSSLIAFGNMQQQRLNDAQFDLIASEALGESHTVTLTNTQKFPFNSTVDSPVTVALTTRRKNLFYTVEPEISSQIGRASCRERV